MHKIFFIAVLFFFSTASFAQDLSTGLNVNDLTVYSMQPAAKPAYLGTMTDSNFGTTIRRISDAGTGGVIKPMYSTIQAWNANESMMILYDQGNGEHMLIDGHSYEFIRYLDDFNPADIEQIFWDTSDPDVLYYPDNSTDDFVKYSVSTQTKEIIVNLSTVSGCTSIALDNDVQMMSWDSDVITFRCGNSEAYSYRISTGVLTTFTISNISYAAPSVGPSGDYFYHNTNSYNSSGQLIHNLNESSPEHSSTGILPNGNDAHFAIAFAQGPEGGCIGDIIAHDLTTGECFPVISQSQGYEYPQSGTHLSGQAHKNSEGGWVAASMVGYDQDGQSLLDQELVIAKAEQGNVKVCRIGHHRSDEDEFNYWGEPHVSISPTGTRVVFGSDWSGAEDGLSVDAYVVELPVFEAAEASSDVLLHHDCIKHFASPNINQFVIKGITANYNIDILTASGSVYQNLNTTDDLVIDTASLPNNTYFINIELKSNPTVCFKKIIKD